MPVNPYFTTGALVGTVSERSLLDDLFVESVQVHGLDVMYLPRTTVALDRVYMEDPLVRFDVAVPIEMYLRSFAAFQGDGDFMSKMGVEVRDQVVFQVSRTRFAEELGPSTAHGLARPREGDLVWYPLNQKLFEIKYADRFTVHYPLGDLYSWELTCELLEYSGQRISTGVPEIDRLASDATEDVLDWGVRDESGAVLTTQSGATWVVDSYDPRAVDPLDDSADILAEADEVIDFSETDVFSERAWTRRD